MGVNIFDAFFSLILLFLLDYRFEISFCRRRKGNASRLRFRVRTKNSPTTELVSVIGLFLIPRRFLRAALRDTLSI